MLNVKKNTSIINRKLIDQKPIILCINNIVSVNDVVNVCSYVNAIPVISTDFNDAKNILSFAKALLLNIGTINSIQEKLIWKLYKVAKEKEIPVVLDPVGYSISKIRTTIIDKILNDDYEKVIIKGNENEICKIIDKDIVVKSVNNELSNSINYLKNVCLNISNKYNKPIIISGKNDIFYYKNETYIIKNGHINMSLISGTGCMLSALIASFVSVAKNISNACVIALVIFSLAGQISCIENKNKLHTSKIDLLNNLNILLNDANKVFKEVKILYENK